MYGLQVAKRNSLWDESKGPLDFLKTYAPPRAHAPYATRRVWRVFNLVAPGTIINPFTDLYGSDYPFSVKTENLLAPSDIMRIQVYGFYVLITIIYMHGNKRVTFLRLKA